MIDTEQIVVIDAPIGQVRAFARNIEGCANLMSSPMLRLIGWPAGLHRRLFGSRTA